ncbi:MAG: DUF1080 domain-containing protein [Acidobacteria bacterium]|nr:MAG: DUF1080 domain-containing protein [Acidobacteriota bacterium]
MRNLWVVVLTLIFNITAVSAQKDPDKKEWIHLFNGKDLKDWDIKIKGHELNDNYKNTFRVEDGVMKVSYDQYDKFNSDFGHIFYREKFSYYRLAVEYRFLGNQVAGGPEWGRRNSGAMLHCPAPQTMLKDQDFPISIEVQFLGGLGAGPRSTANLCTPGTNVEMNGTLVTQHCLNSKSKTYDGDQWVRVEIEVLGDTHVKHIVEGETVIEYDRPQIGGGNVNPVDPAVKQDGKLLSEGYISLQAESHPVEFRRVELLNLVGCMDPKAENYKSYFVKADNSKCEYKKSTAK